MTRFRVFELSAIVALGCGEAGDGGAAPGRCEELRDAIMTSFQENVENGVLLPTAIPCGENGIANRDDYFHERVPLSAINELQRDFGAACDELAASCSGSLELAVVSE